jgi:cytidyltransferase-like protein
MVKDVPETYQADDFRLNVQYLSNEIIELVSASPIIEFCFKTALIAFRYTRKVFKNIPIENKEIILKLKNIINETKVLRYCEFVINENLEDLESSKKIDVNLIIGKFQPLTNGHLKMVDELYETNNLPILIACVRRKDSIIDEETTVKMLSEIIQDDNRIQDFIFVDRLLLGEIFKQASDKFYNVNMIGLGEDRRNDYERQMKYLISNGKLQEEHTLLHILQRTDADISATKVREAIINNNTNYLEQSFPSILHKFIPELQVQLKKKIKPHGSQQETTE